jgi:hypothetical protein
VFVARVANAITTFFGHRIGAVTVQHAQIELLMIGEMLDAGDEGVFE